jgi:hypothetical protein
MSIFSFLFGGRRKQAAGSFSTNVKKLLVRGWSGTEFRQIIGDFQQMYRDRLPQNFTTEVHTSDAGVFRVTFPADIVPRFFRWLINYIQYPTDFDLKSRTILVAGKATMSSDFLPSEQSLLGKSIMFYIPAEEEDHAVVFAPVDGHNYKYPFSSERWRLVQDPRIPIGMNDIELRHQPARRSERLLFLEIWIES